MEEKKVIRKKIYGIFDPEQQTVYKKSQNENFQHICNRN